MFPLQKSWEVFCGIIIVTDVLLSRDLYFETWPGKLIF
jgi:hypothetical protein